MLSYMFFLASLFLAITDIEGTSPSYQVHVLPLCTYGTDCAQKECCVRNRTTSKGQCQLMGKTGRECYVLGEYASVRPVNMITKFDKCPCIPGEFCAGITKYHPFYGQMGICTFG